MNQISKLLKGKRVFVDTQAFRQARFAVSSPSFAKLRELCAARKLTLLTTEITRREIDANILEVASEIKNAIEKIAVLQPDIVLFGLPAKNLTEIDLAKALAKQVNDFFEGCHVEQVKLPRTALATVLDLYFNRQPPFGEHKKKAEFPDAFVLEALKTKAGLNSESVYVVSDDPDFANACTQNPHLKNIKTLSRFLDLYNGHADTINQVHATVTKNFKQIEKELQGIVESLQGVMRGMPGVVRIHSAKVVDILDTLVISCDGPTASVEFVCNVEVDASLETIFSEDFQPDFKRVDRTEVVSIALDFKFDPTNADVFEVQTYWAPAALSIESSSAVH
jgi:hypothetical protein